jgi:hypothetical protein
MRVHCFYLIHSKVGADCIGMTTLNRPPPFRRNVLRAKALDWQAAAPPSKCTLHRKTFLNVCLLWTILAAVILSAGCGGGATSSTGGSGAVVVSVSPSNVTMTSGTIRQLSAVVSNTPNEAVTWSATAGTVSSSGLFTAPAVTATTQIDVIATSKADSSKSATVRLTVNPAASAAVLTVSPTSVNFAGQVGTANLAPASVSITNTGTGTLVFTGVSDQPWLVLSMGSGAAPATLQLRPSVASLKAGTFIGHVTVSGGGVTKAVIVALTMTTAPVQHSVSLSWIASSNSQVVSYSMYRSTIPGTSYGLLASSLGTAMYSDQTVQSGTRYYYVVTAVNDTGEESAYSNEIQVNVP